MIQNPINKDTTLPEPESFALENQSENSLSQIRNDDEQNPLQYPQRNLVVQGELVALDITQSVEFDDRELVHEYRDYGFCYKYRRIRKEKSAEDGTQNEDEVEVDQMILTNELGLEEMYVWASRWNLHFILIFLAMFDLFLIYTTLEWAFFREEEISILTWILWLGCIVILNILWWKMILRQRGLHRNAVVKKEYQEEKIQLSGLVRDPTLWLVIFALLLTLHCYFEKQEAQQEGYF